MDSTFPSTTPPAATNAPGWKAARIAHPVRDLDRSAAFYRRLLGLPVRAGFTDHDGYSGVILALPGGGELELTAGPVPPRPRTEDDLLVLYVAGPEEVRRRVTALESAGVPTMPSANPYWDRWGRTVLDPDGYAVVIAAVDSSGSASDDVAVGPVRIEPYQGERNRLRELFELAEDSPTELDSYLHAGRVLVAGIGAEMVGHLQLVDTGSPGRSEIKNMAVREDLQAHGIGGRLIEAAVDLVMAEGGTELLVATATADVANLRFYQRNGFRMRSVERDAFTPATGYQPGLRIAGLTLRDRVWLDRSLGRLSAA